MSVSGLASDDIDPHDFIIDIDDVRGLPGYKDKASESDKDAEHESETSDDDTDNKGPSSPPPDHTTGDVNNADNSAHSAVDHFVPAQSESQSPLMDDDMPTTPTATVLVPDSSNPSDPTSKVVQPLPPSTSSSAQHDNNDPFDDIVPPSSSLDIPLTDTVILNRKKRNTPDTSRSPGMYHSFICLTSLFTCSTDQGRVAPALRQANRTVDSDTGVRFEKTTRYPKF